MSGVGIIGYGVVGKATAEAFGKDSSNSIYWYDKNIKGPFSLDDVVKNSDFLFVCVPTPMFHDGSGIDLSIIKQVVSKIAPKIKNTKKILIIKSSVVPGTTRSLQKKYPKCIPARILLDTKNPETDYEKIKTLDLADGYSHNIIDTDGKIINMEFSSQNAVMTNPNTPFVHSNHCLVLATNKIEDDYGTISRLNSGLKKISERNSVSEIQKILEDDSLGKDKSINNERTVGRMIIDFENLVAHVWLLREKEKGWVAYPLDFIKK